MACLGNGFGTMFDCGIGGKGTAGAGEGGRSVLEIFVVTSGRTVEVVRDS